MNPRPGRIREPGLILTVDDMGLAVSDLLSQETVEVEPGSHVLTLGATKGRDGPFTWEFCLMETSRVVVIDDMDAAILEMSSAEIA